MQVEMTVQSQGISGTGGGGGGGCIINIYNTKTGSFTNNVNGGQGGQNPPYSPAGNGSPGNIYEIKK